ncbi:MAG: UvrD-helicase domain-containing protein [Cyclobacteriaceae bacterium]|nr:UvrD-helicase domain-containing protein [Cyclobacteriaceae bacterium HetDA_MAG_MS6]
MPKPFLIYRSSAGSGKTFTLAKEYLKLALRYPDAYKSILGVTFTNKATEEMKRRIIEVLQHLLQGKSHPMREELKAALGIDDRALNAKARDILTKILHEYGRFAVVTIDSFFHQVIRSFAREIGLQGSFSIDLDLTKVLQEVIDDLLAELGDENKKELREWLTSFAETKVEDGKSWDFRNDISALAGQITKDSYKQYQAEVLRLGEQPGFFKTFINDLGRQRQEFEKQCDNLARKGLDAIESSGGVEAFSRKVSGPAGLFLKVAAGDFTISDGRRAATGDLSKWLTKENINNTSLVQALEQRIFPLYKSLIDYIDQHIISYNSVQEVHRYFFTFGILSEITKKLQDYRDEKDVMLIADLPDFLNQIIDDSDTPYIYEKVGSIFRHYLIDEFQDTSAFQWSNFRALVKNSTDEGSTSLVVGDVKQSIYRWRGGDWRLLQDRVKEDIGDYNVQEEHLSTNWRSASGIVNFNNQFFSDALPLAHKYFEGIDESLRVTLEKALSAYEDVIQESVADKDTGYVNISFFESDEMSDWQQMGIAKTIALVEELQEKGYALRDIAVLTRTQREGKRVADAFMQYKNTEQAKPHLKYDVVSSEALYLFSSHSVKFIISMIKWLNHEENTIVLSEWLYEYRRYVLGQSVADDEIFGGYKHWMGQVPSEFKKQKDYLKTLPLYELVELLIRIFELNKLQEEYTYLQGFQDAVLDYSKNERGDIPSFLIWWENIRKERAIQIADENDAVKILTIHKSKGLEFPIIIIPFLNWKLDHDTYSKEEILWCRGLQEEPLNQLPIVPLRYSSKLADTVWSDIYWQEKISAFLDNLNLLYVAFTRPIDALFAFADLTKTDKMYHVGQLTHQLVEPKEGWQPDLHRFEKGSISEKRQSEDTHSIEHGLGKYHAHPWRGKVSLQMKGAVELSEQNFEAQQWGVSLHHALSRIHHLEDLYALEDEHLKRELKLIVHHEDIEPFFKDIDEAKIEAPILLPGGSYKRIDRLIRKGDTWQVIDFKTGLKRGKDQQQVQSYVDILRDMGYEKVEGYIVYLDPVEVVNTGAL